MGDDLNMHTTMWPIENVQPYERNPRKNDAAVAAVEASLREFGFRQPIVVDDQGVVIVGHTRLLAAKIIGMDEVPVHVATGMTPQQARAYRLADNKTAELADWDVDKLAEEIAQIQIDDEIDLSQFGFDLSAFEDEPEGLTDPDDVPEPPADPITKPGDLWTLGEHRLLCGDSTNAEHVARLMGGEKAELCFTSPPYGQQRSYDSGQGSGDWDALMRGVFEKLPMTDSGQVLVNLGLVHRKDEWIPYWDGWIEWMRQQGWRRFGWYVWDQGPGLPGDWNGRFAPSFEFVFHFNKKSVRPVKNTDCKFAGELNHGTGMRKSTGEEGRYSHSGKTVQSSKIPDNVIRITRHKARGIEVTHPAVFPVALPAFIASSWLGILYEPFCGSGTTIIAAETLGRRCFGMEISPAYCDVIVKRWEQHTGRIATRG